MDSQTRKSRPGGRGWPRLALALTAAAAMVWGFRLLLFDHAPVAFSSDLDDMSYAYFVPLFSLYVLWRRRREIAASSGAPSPWALPLMVFAYLIALLGVRGLQIRFEILAFALLVVAYAWALWGWRTAREIAFPALFLLFCMPMATFLDVVTVHLRLLAVTVAHSLMGAFGLGVIRRGTMLLAADGSFSIDVAAPCSGLRSLFAMMALTAGYAYFALPTWPRRVLLFALSIPLAIIGNIARIFTIALIGVACSPEFAQGFYHDYSGYVVFLTAIALMLAAGGLLARGPVAPRPAAAAGPAAPLSPRAAVFAVAVTALFVAAMAYLGAAREPALADAPAVVFPELPVLASRDLGASDAELKVLPADTRICRRLYEAPGGGFFVVTAVIGGREKSSIHRPELCLPSQGFQMERPRTVDAGAFSWRILGISRGLGTAGFAYTFFNQAGYRTSSHFRRIFRDVWDRSVYARIDRWVMVTVTSERVTEAETLSFLRAWSAAFALPEEEGR